MKSNDEESIGTAREKVRERGELNGDEDKCGTSSEQ